MSELVQQLDGLPMAVRKERMRRGLSLRAAADEMGASFNSLTRLEQGRNSTRDVIRAAALWLSATQAVDVMVEREVVEA